jgi:hypothetical protein
MRAGRTLVDEPTWSNAYTGQRRPSKQSAAICSDRRPIRKMTTDTISSTDEFVRCDCVAIVHAAYKAQRRNTRG